MIRRREVTPHRLLSSFIVIGEKKEGGEGRKEIAVDGVEVAFRVT